MKTTMLKAGLISAVSLLGIAPAFADEGTWGGFSAGVTGTTDYRFRGISNSDNGPAIQPWVQYDHKSGLFVNVWGSNIDFDDDATYDSNIEVDFTLGYNHAFSDNTTGTAKVVYYWYADADAPAGFPDYDYWDFIVGLEHDFGEASVSAELAYSPDNFAETGDSVALLGGIDIPVAETFLFFNKGLAISTHVGHQWLDIGEDYLWYDLGATATWNNVSVDLRWVDTDISNVDCAGPSDICDGTVVLSVSASWGG